MFYYLNGTITILDTNLAVVDCGGVGYACHTTNYTISRLQVGRQARLYTYCNIKEDAFDIFGFYTREELDCFEKLLSVGGVGPKAALAILSVVTPDQFTLAVMTQDVKTLTMAQGVAMAAALSRGLAVSEYAPMRIKQSITGRGSAAKEQVAAIVCRILSIDQPPRRLDATDGMAVALCHHFTTASPLNTALGDERVKGLGGGKKAASKRGSQSWEKFLKDHPDREIK